MKKLKLSLNRLIFPVILVVFLLGGHFPAASQSDIPMLDNPVTVEYLRKNLRKSQPRLVLNSTIERSLKSSLKTDPVVQNVYSAIQDNAAKIFELPLLERIQIGRRLLTVSREMLYRMNMLGMVYRMEGDPKVLKRINEELIAVCNFTDWNPSHYLDVAEMSMAVAIGLDWTAGKLPKSTVAMVKKALIEKGIQPSWPEDGKSPGWANGTNNWNQVCNGGMIAASIAIAEEDPELAAKTIARALNGIPRALNQYRPDGVYPEGSTYWEYGTSFSVMTTAMLESAFGDDFGHTRYPGFLESAVYRALMNTPSGWYYNFADCGDKRDKNGDMTLAWFASKTGNATLFEKERFLMPVAEMNRLGRLDGAGLVWLSQFREKEAAVLPKAWAGRGANPIVIFTGDSNDPRQYYFGGKGGRGTTSHGNMDGGSFIFELNGVRWSIDPGNQAYHTLEATGFDLWNSCQDCERWTLLTKNNFGHSTLTVNEQLHINNGMSELLDFKDGDKPEATFDLTAAFGETIGSAQRRFVKDSPASLTIEDKLVINGETRLIQWQMITTADVEIVRGGAILRQNGKELKLENLSHPDLVVSVVSLYPAPLQLDRQMQGLKRLEIRIPAWTVQDKETTLRVRLSGE